MKQNPYVVVDQTGAVCATAKSQANAEKTARSYTKFYGKHGDSFEVMTKVAWIESQARKGGAK